MLYNIPGRCGVDVTCRTTVDRLATACANIVCIKEASGSVDRVAELRATMPNEFTILSGDDGLTVPFMSVGAVGVVSVASNLLPGGSRRAWSAPFESGDTIAAEQMHRRLHGLFKDLFIEPNPVPVKTALAWRGLMTSEVRLPLCEMREANRARLRATLDAFAEQSRHERAAPHRVDRCRGSDGSGDQSTPRRSRAMRRSRRRGPGPMTIDDSIGEYDVLIDFSHAKCDGAKLSAACRAIWKAARDRHHRTIERASEVDSRIAAASKIPLVLLASNFSIGVNTLFWLTRKANALLGDGFDLEIIETHHRLKKDAPSGTAKRLAQILCEERGLDYEKDVVHGREGLVGERPAKQIGMHAIRAGDVVGDHTVIFAAPGERLELTHKASSRETFAVGALRAARWIIGQPAGLYDMEDVLGLR